jgi:hypothetical protein
MFLRVPPTTFEDGTLGTQTEMQVKEIEKF